MLHFMESIKMNFNFDPMNIDLIARPGEAFLKCMGFVSLGTIIETNLLNIYSVHLPPIVLELAQMLAYLGAGVAFIKFMINLFRKKSKIFEE